MSDNREEDRWFWKKGVSLRFPVSGDLEVCGGVFYRRWEYDIPVVGSVNSLNSLSKIETMYAC